MFMHVDRSYEYHVSVSCSAPISMPIVGNQAILCACSVPFAEYVSARLPQQQLAEPEALRAETLKYDTYACADVPCTHLFRSTRRGLGPRSSRIRGFARWHVANLTRDEMQTVRKTPISSRCALAHHLRRRWPDFLREAGTAHATAAILRVGHTTGACMFQSRAGMAGFMRSAARVSLTADACAPCAAIVEWEWLMTQVCHILLHSKSGSALRVAKTSKGA